MTKEEEVLNLIYSDEPLKALELADKYQLTELSQKIKSKLGHVYHPELYLAKYADESMSTSWGEKLFVADEWQERFKWIMDEIREHDLRSLIDLGCYEAALVLTSSRKIGTKSRGVELCKVAAERANLTAISEGINACVYQGSIEDFQTTEKDEKFDAVVCCEVIEHLLEPQKLIEKMVSLVSDKGFMFLTTPNGVYDSAITKRNWGLGDFLMSHLRTYNSRSIRSLLKGYKVEIVPSTDRLLHVKFWRQK